MKTIYKYPLDAVTMQAVLMPEGATILTAAYWQGEVCVWAEVETTALMEYRYFEAHKTGAEMAADMGIDRRYIATVFMPDDGLVFHIYERTGV